MPPPFRPPLAFRHVVVFFVLAIGIATADPVPLTTEDGFAVPQPGHVFEFPRAHGSHPEFKIEWWYVTGHLHAEEGRRFGYQATFFRQAAEPKPRQVFLAHMALTDLDGRRFLHQERLHREGWQAHASTEGMDLRNGPWTLRMENPDTGQMHLRGGVRAEAMFELTLTPTKPLVLFGEGGISRKGEDPTKASYYLTFSRLVTEGTLELDGQRFPVRGESWLDHEISSSQLDEGQIGWDWVSIQFADGRELKSFNLRLRDGRSDPASILTWVDAEGQTTHRPHHWEVRRTWRSPTTGAVYPVAVRLHTEDPATNRTVFFDVDAYFDACELTGAVGGIAYWEGPCRVRDDQGRVVGSAFLELTGYAADISL